MGQTTPAALKSLAFKVLERIHAVPDPVPIIDADEKVAENPIGPGLVSGLDFKRQANSAEQFGQSHAMFFPLIGKRVSTPRGPGRLETAFARRCEVVLDSEPGKMTVFLPAEIGALI